MSELFPLTPAMWQDWARDESSLIAGWFIFLFIFCVPIYVWNFLVFSVSDENYGEEFNFKQRKKSKWYKKMERENFKHVPIFDVWLFMHE